MITIDNGVGYGEFWGAPFYDRQLFDVSSCCEAGVIDDDWACEPDECITEYDMEGAQA